jgi:plasmid stabilization system protein ParE
VRWTRRALDDLDGIRWFIARDSVGSASLVVNRLVAAAERLGSFPELGRVVPEFGRADVRELIRRPYRIVYRLVEEDELHVIAVHHSAQRFPRDA